MKSSSPLQSSTLECGPTTCRDEEAAQGNDVLIECRAAVDRKPPRVIQPTKAAGVVSSEGYGVSSEQEGSGPHISDDDRQGPRFNAVRRNGAEAWQTRSTAFTWPCVF